MMGKTNKERILDYLWLISPEAATNAQIRDATGISSHQVVYMLTQELRRTGKIQGEKRGREWFFWADDSLAQQLFSPGWVSDAEVEEEPQEFKQIAQSVMSWHFEVDLEAGTVPGVAKEFDMVSSDRDVVGDARYFAPVRRYRLPMVFSTITENVWVLENTGASFPFLVFGNDRQVPLLWLERYGQLVESVGFYFIDDDGQLEDLFEPPKWDEPNPLFDSNEWDQRRATWRSIKEMRRIAQDAMELDDHHDFCMYAKEHDIPVNEIVYYLNAYEAGGDAGLEAIRNPDIIPPDVARRAVKEITRTLDARFEGHSLRYRVTDEGTAIGVYQVQERANGEEFLFRICQFRLTLEGMKWHLYWMRKFDAWWPYSLPKRGRRFTLRARLQQVLEDEYGCFWV